MKRVVYIGQRTGRIRLKLECGHWVVKRRWSLGRRRMFREFEKCERCEHGDLE